MSEIRKCEECGKTKGVRRYKIIQRPDLTSSDRLIREGFEVEENLCRRCLVKFIKEGYEIWYGDISISYWNGELFARKLIDGKWIRIDFREAVRGTKVIDK